MVGVRLSLLNLCVLALQALGARKILSKGPMRAIPHLYLWAVIHVTWVCFAVTDPYQLPVYLGRMLGVTDGIRVSAGDWLRALETYWYLFGFGALACTPVLHKLYRRWKDSVIVRFLLVALFWLCVWRLQVEGNNPFMYFRIY